MGNNFRWFGQKAQNPQVLIPAEINFLKEPV